MGNSCAWLQTTLCCDNFEISLLLYQWVVVCTYFCITFLSQRKYVIDQYSVLSEKSHLLYNKHFRYQMNYIRCNKELINPLAEHNIFLGRINLPYDHTNHYPDLIITIKYYKGICEIIDSCIFNGDRQFHMLSKYRKMPINQTHDRSAYLEVHDKPKYCIMAKVEFFQLNKHPKYRII